MTDPNRKTYRRKLSINNLLNFMLMMLAFIENTIRLTTKEGLTTDEIRTKATKGLVRLIATLGVTIDVTNPGNSKITLRTLAAGVMTTLGAKRALRIYGSSGTLAITAVEKKGNATLVSTDGQATKLTAATRNTILDLVVKPFAWLAQYTGAFFGWYSGEYVKAIAHFGSFDGINYYRFTVPGTTLVCVHFVNGNNDLVVAIGENGKVYMANLDLGFHLTESSGGKGWKEVASPLGEPIQSISEARDGEMVFVSANGNWARVNVAAINTKGLPANQRNYVIIGTGRIAQDASFADGFLVSKGSATAPAVFALPLTEEGEVVRMAFVPPTTFAKTAPASA